MADRKTIHQLINEAIRTNTTVNIRYRDYHGNTSTREISPLEWVEPEKILAFCHLRNEQRNFNANNIIEISKDAFVPVEQFVPSMSVQPQIQAVNSRPIPRPNSAQRPQANPAKFTKVTTSDQWNSLMGYYRECLNHEYQQQFSMSKIELFPLVLDEKIVYSFLAGNHNLELRPTFRQDRMREFLDDSRRRNQQLCLGKSFVCLNSDKISPLLFAPVTIEKGFNDVVVLKPEECNLSYAALMNLGFEADVKLPTSLTGIKPSSVTSPRSRIQKNLSFKPFQTGYPDRCPSFHTKIILLLLLATTQFLMVLDFFGQIANSPGI